MSEKHQYSVRKVGSLTQVYLSPHKPTDDLSELLKFAEKIRRDWANNPDDKPEIKVAYSTYLITVKKKLPYVSNGKKYCGQSLAKNIAS